MNLVRLRAAARFDSGWWRRFAELGCVYSPEWWRRGSPPVIAAIIFTMPFVILYLFHRVVSLFPPTKASATAA